MEVLQSRRGKVHLGCTNNMGRDHALPELLPHKGKEHALLRHQLYIYREKERTGTYMLQDLICEERDCACLEHMLCVSAGKKGKKHVY